MLSWFNFEVRFITLKDFRGFRRFLQHRGARSPTNLLSRKSTKSTLVTIAPVADFDSSHRLPILHETIDEVSFQHFRVDQSGIITAQYSSENKKWCFQHFEPMESEKMEILMI